ncbi:MAG: hypothetical protein K8L97_33570 [Anaerolineae bacterium]|nr:hypothetical protein [Anaerolineae bacterium]
MKLPTELQQMVQQRLGEKALEAQREYGRGVWIITTDAGDQASYVLRADLHTLFKERYPTEFNQLIEAVDKFDPASQIVILFKAEVGLQALGIVDIA